MISLKKKLSGSHNKQDFFNHAQACMREAECVNTERNRSILLRNAYRLVTMAIALEPRNSDFNKLRKTINIPIEQQREIETSIISLFDTKFKLLNGLKRRKSKIKVTIISGFLGSGKTTFLNRLISNVETKKHKYAVFVNDMSKVNIDASLVKRVVSDVVELSNGCICCGLRQAFFEQVLDTISATEDIVEIFIEASGISEMYPIAQMFLFSDKQGRSLARLCQLTYLVSVISVTNLDILLDWQDSKYEELLKDQIKYASVILVNKIDTVHRNELESKKSSYLTLLSSLNSGAEVVFTTYSAVELSQYEKAVVSEDMLRKKFTPTVIDSSVSEKEEYGVDSIEVQFSDSLSRDVFNSCLSKLCSEKLLLRAKGFVSFGSVDKVFEFHVSDNCFDLREVEVSAEALEHCGVFIAPVEDIEKIKACIEVLK